LTSNAGTASADSTTSGTENRLDWTSPCIAVIGSNTAVDSHGTSIGNQTAARVRTSNAGVSGSTPRGSLPPQYNPVGKTLPTAILAAFAAFAAFATGTDGLARSALGDPAGRAVFL
jgi:hypothetical protein